MSDSYSDPQQQAGQGDGGRDGQRSRGNRGGGREGGGFRIRLSDNEMRSARALQEAFNLRSTVAVLGFAVRSLGQMLEDGQLDALIEQQKISLPEVAGVMVVVVMVVVVAAALTMSVVAAGPVRIPLPDQPNPSRRLQLNRLPSRRPNQWWSRWWSQKQPPATTPIPQQPRPD